MTSMKAPACHFRMRWAVPILLICLRPCALAYPSGRFGYVFFRATAEVNHCQPIGLT
jgi:hypothetical protein